MTARRLCPMTADGHHLLIMTAWGQSCRACHRTWVWRDKDLVPTWPDPPLGADVDG